MTLQSPSRWQAVSLERLIQGGLLMLTALMPFHAFLSVWLGSLTGQQAIIQAWKEVLLLILAVLACIHLVRTPSARRRLAIWPAKLALAFATVALLVTLIAQPSLTAAAFGIKTDLEFLLAFLLAILVGNAAFARRLIGLTLLAASVVVGFGILQFSLLPNDFLANFGYGAATIPPYLTLDPALHDVRFGSTLGGPNQLGTYLMLPLALAGLLVIRRRQWQFSIFILGGLLVLFHTYSRSAWLGTIVASLTVLAIAIPAKWRFVGLAIFGSLCATGAWLVNRLALAGENLQQYFVRGANSTNHRSSDLEHAASLQTGLTASLNQPLGHGLGTAGPAVFQTGTGIVIENNYLQLAYETSLLGAATFLVLIGSLAWSLSRRAQQQILAGSVLAAIAGVSVAAIVLPAWTDSTTALTVWIAAGATLSLRPEEADYV